MARNTASATARHPLLSIALAAALCAPAAALAGCSAGQGDESDGAGEVDAREDSVSGGTVAQAVSNSCSTSSVKGLSKQIIAEARCIQEESFVKVPGAGKVTFGSSVFRYLEKPAKDRLVAALESKPGRAMTVNSMLRTISQQYLLYRWYQTGRCGIGLAAKPGNSNHETGLALDVSEHGSWRATLQARGFRWLGDSDPVHFDYAGSGAKSHKGLDVQAFQRLWNRNHTGDKISVDGDWGPETESRMKKSPADGFAKGASCGSSSQGYAIDDADLVATEEEENGYDRGAALGGAEGGEVHEHGALLDEDTVGSAALPGVEDATALCATCFQSICDADSYCCETDWDDRCVAEGTRICDALCGEDVQDEAPPRE